MQLYSPCLMTTTPSSGCLVRSEGNKIPFKLFPFSYNIALATPQRKPCHVSDTAFSNATFSLSAPAYCYQAAVGTEYLMHVSQSKSMAAGLEHAYVGVLVKSRRICLPAQSTPVSLVIAAQLKGHHLVALSCRRPTTPTTNFIGNKALRFDGMISLAQTRMPRLDGISISLLHGFLVTLLPLALIRRRYVIKLKSIVSLLFSSYLLIGRYPVFC
ncbi:hypothetical protein HDV64DRAFT_5427 [Trichoderma sp. TUCIM 5745]